MISAAGWVLLAVQSAATPALPIAAPPAADAALPPRTPPPPPPRLPPDPGLPVMAALYDEVCLGAFPDDAAVERAMAAKGAVPLTADQVRVTFGSDPGRGWLLADGGRQIQIMLELPPYHACSVRRTLLPGFAFAEYRTVSERFKATRPGFSANGPQYTDKDGVRIAVRGDVRTLPDGRTESLMVIDQQVTDPARRAAGAVGVDIRFVHQLLAPGVKCC